MTKSIQGYILVFIGIWMISYHLNPVALGAHVRSFIGFGVFAGITTAGIFLVTQGRGDAYGSKDSDQK